MLSAETKRIRLWYLAVSVVSLLFCGVVYSFSMFAGPLCSAYDLDGGQVDLTFNILMITFCVSAVLSALMREKLGEKGCIIIGAALFALGYGGLALSPSKSIAVLYLCHGICVGGGVGLSYNCIVSMANEWFPDKVGFSSGVLMTGFGMGSLVVGTFFFSLYEWGVPLRQVFASMGMAGGLALLAAALVLRKPPESLGPAVSDGPSLPAEGGDGRSVVAVRSPLMHLYWLWATLIAGVGLSVIGSCAGDALQMGFSEMNAALLVGLVSAFNGMASVVVGVIYDKTSPQRTMVLNGVLATCATACLSVGFMMNLPALYVIGTLVCGFCYGGVPTVASAFSLQLFGKRWYPLNLATANFSIVFASVLNGVASALFAEGPRGFLFVFLVALSFASIFVVRPFQKRLERSGEQG